MRFRTGDDRKTDLPPEPPQAEAPPGADDVKVAGDRTDATPRSGTRTGSGTAPEVEPAPGAEPGPAIGPGRAAADAPPPPAPREERVDAAHPAMMADAPEAGDGSVESTHAGATAAKPAERLIEPDRAERLRKRWHDVQAGFVDDPEAAVRGAEDLTGEVFAALSEALESRRKAVRETWSRGTRDGGTPGGGTSDSGTSGGDAEGPDTERLRLALREYRDLVRQVIGT